MGPVRFVLAGVGVGAVFGIFGAGGSAFATPILALLGVPGLAAVASPLPAMVPAALGGGRRYLRAGNLDRRVAALSVLGGAPGTIIGSLASDVVGGPILLVLSGVLLLVIGVRLLMPDATDAAERAAERRERRCAVIASTFVVGLLTGLLANGGGFLLVPLFMLVLGMSAAEAAGTSMVVVAVLTLPTVISHIALGHVNWTVAGGFALGMIPAAQVGAAVSQRIPTRAARWAFGLLLVGFSIWFLIDRLT